MPNHTQRAHAPFSPSASEIWLNCTAAVPLTEQMPHRDDRSDASVFGTICHELAEAILTNPEATVAMSGNLMEQAAARAARECPDMPEVDRNLARIESIVLPYIRHIEDARRNGGEAHIEEKGLLIRDEVYGTPDAVVINGNMVEIVDLKTGSGHAVDPDHNTQLLTYAAQVLKRSKRLGDDLTVIRLTIVQAMRRDGKPAVTSWDCLTDDVRKHIDRVEHAVSVARGPFASPRLGDHCQWCKAKSACPAQLAQTKAVLATSDPIPTPLATMTPEQIARVLDAEPQITAWLKSVKDAAIANPPPGYKLVEGRANRKWSSEAEAIARAAGVWDTISETSLIGIPAAEKALKSIDPTLIDRMTVKPPGKPTLAKADDRRPEIADPLTAL